ncbi:hypothetical protein WH47_01582 [Habropoda laboriosa]|uniref:Uncharacterized protein n=1 Tax=Habropoda laboriosa TaxID=597456 RepID=A0A0L7R0N3_9HYME|nr:hypothetical protein WH47_01582 [Habropoda laboriosa]
MSEYRAHASNYNDNSLGGFQRQINAMIGGGIKTSDRATHEEVLLWRLAASLALTLYRFATKNIAQMSNTFRNTRYRSNLVSLAGWLKNKPFSPPCDQCLIVCERALRKGLPTTSDMFTLLSVVFVHAKNADYENASAGEYLAASVLTYTAGNGIGIIQMMEQVCVITNLKREDLSKRMYFLLNTKASWDKIDSFFSQQAPSNGVVRGPAQV